MRPRLVALAGIVAVLVLCLDVPARPQPPAERPSPYGLTGAVVAVGGEKPADTVLDRFVELARGEKAEIVVVTIGGPDSAGIFESLKVRKPMSVTALALTTKNAINEPAALDALKRATGAWLVATDASTRAAELVRNTPIERELRDLRLRGGVVAASGSATALLTGTLLADDGDSAVGLDLLPGALFGNTDDALKSALEKSPGLLGLRVPGGSALVVRGREVRALSGPVSLHLPRTTSREPRTVEVKPGARAADFNELWRAARARAAAPYPPAEPLAPEVPSGTLVIVGGGGMPADITKRFIEAGGGVDGHFVVLPIAMPDPIRNDGGSFLRQRGVKDVVAVSLREKKDLEDPKILDVFKKATGIWFGGGRQWNFMDAYEGTAIPELMRDVLRRGGVIGGSSAGATIQGDYLVRGAPAGPNIMMCEGYEQGLCFLPGVAIDQHFTARNRFKDMTALMRTYPQFLGIGLDEATAIVVKGSVAEVMGRGKVHVYDRRKPVADGKPDYDAYAAGSRYDLKARRLISAPAAAEAATATVTPDAVASILSGLPARNIGPANMGGRITDVAVADVDARTWYVAVGNGGVWKTTDAGDHFTPIFDSQSTLGIGAVAVAPSNPEVVYVGTGEVNPRNSVSWGHGICRTTDGGKTWSPLALSESHHVGRIVVHPTNPDVAYAAVLGHLWGPNKERGVYKTGDGGKTWQQSKFLDDNTGFVDVAMDPTNPNVLYAAAYPVRRDGFSGGAPQTQWGPHGGLYKTTDGGESWMKMTNGLPDRPYGRCGFSIYLKDPRVVFAVVQTDRTDDPTGNRGQVAKANEKDVDKGGIFRSDDRGTTWKKLNDLVPRPFYYGQIRVDPNDEQRIYVLGVSRPRPTAASRLRTALARTAIIMPCGLTPRTPTS